MAYNDVTQETEDQSEQPQDLVEYNLSAMKIGQIGMLIREADYFYLQGKIKKAFFRYKCICFHIKSRLSKKEKGLLRRIEILFYYNSKKVIMNLKKDFVATTDNKTLYYEKYVDSIQKLLKHYGFDIREREFEEHLF